MMVRSAAHPASAPLPARRTQIFLRGRELRRLASLPAHRKGYYDGTIGHPPGFRSSPAPPDTDFLRGRELRRIAPLPRAGHRRRQYPTEPIRYARKRSMVVRRTLFFCGVFRTQRQRKVANRYAGAANRKARQASLPAGLFCIFGAGLSAWPSACPASGRADTGYVYCCSAFASVPMYVSRV